MNDEKAMTGIELLPSQKVTVEMGVQAFASKIKPLFSKNDTQAEKRDLKYRPVLETEDAVCL